MRDPGAVEIGYQGGCRWTVGLEERPIADGQPGMTLDKDSVFLVTGAAGSIVSAITADLAAASGGTFYLLDLVPEPDPANPDLDRFSTDKEALKRDLFARIQARGERATPALVEKELAALERAACRPRGHRGGARGRRRRPLLQRQPHRWRRRGESGRRTSAARSGRIDVLLHAAGIDRSHLLKDKDPREFDLVFDVKADGLFHLLHAIGDMPLGAMVGFSSIAGRFGNGGQTDYSSANDLLMQGRLELPPHAARDARHRHRLDRLGRHRHGHPRLHPEGHGDGRHRHAAARGRHSVDPPRADRRRRQRRSGRGRAARRCC